MKNEAAQGGGRIGDRGQATYSWMAPSPGSGRVPILDRHARESAEEGAGGSPHTCLDTKALLNQKRSSTVTNYFKELLKYRKPLRNAVVYSQALWL